MKTITRNQFARFSGIPLILSFIGCQNPHALAQANPLKVDANSVQICSEQDTPRPPFEFSVQDNQFLDEIERATFDYFWEAVSPETGMVYDRTSSDVISIAGVGFQLAALPIGVERGWVTRQEGQSRAQKIISALQNEPSNRKAGLFYHFINPQDASARRVGRELVVSTVDSALLFSGMLVAGEYFGGLVQTQCNQLFAQADWSSFLGSPGAEFGEQQFLSLGWKPESDEDPTGEGELLPYFWIDSGDEHRLTTFLAVCAPNPDFRVPTAAYWGLRRQLGWHQGQGHMVWFPYSGALFTSIFAHCFIDYNTLGLDDPSVNNQAQRARVDWWENSRRIVNLHRDRAIENPLQLPTLGPDAWGFSASDGPNGYLVSGQFPTPVEMIGSMSGRDYSTFRPDQLWGDGVIAPYAAGSSIMFEPKLAVSALRFAHGTTWPDGSPGVWHGGHPGGWGFTDAFEFDEHGDIVWVAEDFVAISQGPLILGIENARTGLIWDLFQSNAYVERGIVALNIGTNP